MQRSGIARSDQLLTEALLNPELAKTLMMKPSPGNRPFIAQRLASQLGTLAATAGLSTSQQRRAAASPASRVVPQPMAVPRLIPGGAVQLQFRQ
jgi:hypothetical protein